MKMLLRCSLSHPSLVPHLITKAFGGSFQFSQLMSLLNFTSFLGLQSKFQMWASGKRRFLRVGLAPRLWSYNRPRLGVKQTQWVFLGRWKQIRPYTLGTKLSPRECSNGKWQFHFQFETWNFVINTKHLIRCVGLNSCNT